MDFRTQSVIMTLGCVCVCGGGLSLMTFWNSEKLSNFKAHELWWTINELCTGILRVPSCCLPIAHIHKRTLLKNHPSAVFSFKMQHKRQNKHTHTNTHTHTHTHTNDFTNVLQKISIKICFALKVGFSHKKLYSMYSSFYCFNFLLLQTAVKLRN